MPGKGTRKGRSGGYFARSKRDCDKGRKRARHGLILRPATFLPPLPSASPPRPQHAVRRHLPIPLPVPSRPAPPPCDSHAFHTCACHGDAAPASSIPRNLPARSFVFRRTRRISSSTLPPASSSSRVRISTETDTRAPRENGRRVLRIDPLRRSA
jgi:hypothetical protein